MDILAQIARIVAAGIAAYGGYLVVMGLVGLGDSWKGGFSAGGQELGPAIGKLAGGIVIIAAAAFVIVVTTTFIAAVQAA